MTLKQALTELKKMGTAQNRKVYQRHGVRKEMFGVSFANLGKLKRKIKIDHELAKQLWATGNHDAQILAAMIVDPQLLADTQVESWAKDLGNYPLADAFSGLVSKSRLAPKKMKQWTKSSDEWIGQTGWNLLAHLALRSDEFPDADFENYLGLIERKIQRSKNRVRYAMNNALIAIGMRNDFLEARAIAVAEKIGRVDVDHGETNCKTPDAAAYIRKARSRKGN
jgi:3-methyladenine DNA glycosylase AlkD